MRDHPSFSSGQSYSVKPVKRTSGSMGAVQVSTADAGAPELELSVRHAPKPAAPKPPSLAPPAPKKPSPPRTLGSGSGAPPKAIAAPGAGGAVFDEDDIFSPGGGAGEAIELDMMPGGPGPGVTSSPAAVKPTPSAPAPTVPDGRGTMGKAPERLIEDSESRVLADYGESPTSFWQAPLYLYRVKTRQSELRRQLGERKLDLARATKTEEQARIAFAERARPTAETLDGYSEVLAPIGKAEGLMTERHGALSADVEAHKARLAVIDERVRGLSVELDAAKAEEREIEVKLAEADGIRQRADAKLKRAEIEIRNATTAAEAGGVKLGPARRAGPPT
jgi:hypothetical protein